MRIAFFLLISLCAAPVFAAKDEIYTSTFSNTAVKGYDTVAYFTEGEPVKGSDDYSTEWKGAQWHFASQENLDKFKANPEQYAPQYGGYCAYAVSQGATAAGDPELWRIVDDKLYLNYNRKAQQNWEKDIPGHIAQADENWPGVLN